MRDKLHHIRHAAVHRLPTSVSSLKLMLADAQLLTNGLRDVPRSNKLRAMALALESHDVKAVEAIIAAPLSSFNNAANSQSFQTQIGHSDNGFQQKENICLPRCETGSWQRPEGTQSASQQPGIGDPMRPGLTGSDGFLYAVDPKNVHSTSSDVPIQSIEGKEDFGQYHSEYSHSLGKSTTNSSVLEQGISVQLRNLKGLKRSDTIKLEAANHQAGVIKYLAGPIDLTIDSDDEDPSTTVHEQAKLKNVIDLTGDEPVVLFRSARAIEIKDW
jgi:hypothetical protein